MYAYERDYIKEFIKINMNDKPLDYIKDYIWIFYEEDKTETTKTQCKSLCEWAEKWIEVR